MLRLSYFRMMLGRAPAKTPAISAGLVEAAIPDGPEKSVSADTWPCVRPRTSTPITSASSSTRTTTESSARFSFSVPERISGESLKPFVPIFLRNSRITSRTASLRRTLP